MDVNEEIFNHRWTQMKRNLNEEGSPDGSGQVESRFPYY
jgi:hypothetical protein